MNAKKVKELRRLVRMALKSHPRAADADPNVLRKAERYMVRSLKKRMRVR